MSDRKNKYFEAITCIEYRKYVERTLDFMKRDEIYFNIMEEV